jgi:hypothetical protein
MAEATITPPPPTRQSTIERQPGPALPEMAIEIACPLNRNLLWGPRNIVLRGRWDSHNLTPGDQSQAGLLKMPVLPGIQLRLDARNRRATITDPLADDENRSLLNEANAVHEAVFGSRFSPWDEVVYEDMSDDALATWMYWMMRAVNAGNARVLDGRIPQREQDIRRTLPGAVIVKKFQDSAEQYANSQTREAAAALDTQE